MSHERVDAGAGVAVFVHPRTGAGYAIGRPPVGSSLPCLWRVGQHGELYQVIAPFASADEASAFATWLLQVTSPEVQRAA